MSGMPLKDFSLPVPCSQGPEDAPSPWRQANVTPELLERVLDALARSPESSGDISDDDLFAAWQRTLEVFRDPASTPRRRLDPHLSRLYGYSAAALQGALESMLDGVMGRHGRAVFDDAGGRRNPRPVWVVLASNIPALAVQAVLPALALRRPVLVKSSSVEPLFTPLWVDTLVDHEPRLRGLLAALTWPGGEVDVESEILPKVGRVVAYGGGEAMADLGRRCGSKLIPLGPKMSLAVIGSDASPAAVAAGLAEDIALFEQKGCLSVQAVFSFGDAESLADHLAAALQDVAERWPMGCRASLAEVRQGRDEGIMRGLYQPPLALEQGTVWVEEAGAELQPSPGGRSVRIYPVAGPSALLAALEPWRGRLQGAALAGDAWALEGALLAMGFSRCAPPGALQHPDSGWHNGGVSLLETLVDDPAG